MGGLVLSGPCSFLSTHVGEAWAQDAWKTGAYPMPRFEDQIHRSRIFPVPDATVQRAIKILEYREVHPLDAVRTAELLPGVKTDPEAMLRAEIEEAEGKASESGDMIRTFPQHKKRFAEEAKEWHTRAEKAAKLSGKLKAFLIRGLVLFEGTGAFQVYAKDEVLWVVHSSLGKGPVRMTRRPVVVFLDRRPEEIYVSAGAGGPSVKPPSGK